MIRESIDYVDRFRISYYERHGDNNANCIILDSIKGFYDLYSVVNSYMLECECKNTIDRFIKIWSGSFNKKLIEKINNCEKKRIDRNRPIQNYYVCYDENIENAIQKLKNDEPLSSLYKIIDKQKL